MALSSKTTLKKFYKNVTSNKVNTGYHILLDDKPLKTPARKLLVVPTSQLANAIVKEWDAQSETIEIDKLDMTKLANTACDGVVGNEQAIVDDIVKFSSSDVVCYRAVSPEALHAKQVAAWDPILVWVKKTFNAPFQVTQSIQPIQQPQSSIDRIAAHVGTYHAYELSALHLMTTLLGSALIALAHVHGFLDLNKAWTASHIDEDWQITHWGEDFDASLRQQKRRHDFELASRFFGLVKN